MRNRKRILYERKYRQENKRRLYLYRRMYEKKNWKRISKYRNAYKKRYQKEHPIKHWRSTRNMALKRNFGITLIEYQDILKRQGNRCAICPITTQKNGKDFAVDHCHKSDKIRGLLCSQCNVGLGMFRDNKKYLGKAIKYLCN